MPQDIYKWMCIRTGTCTTGHSTNVLVLQGVVQDKQDIWLMYKEHNVQEKDMHEMLKTSLCLLAEISQCSTIGEVLRNGSGCRFSLNNSGVGTFLSQRIS
jgi:hypothetical protein